MVEVIDFNDIPVYLAPAISENLETLVRFPDGEYKREGIPNSSIWIYPQRDHIYHSDILSNDVGCGMAAFMVSIEDVKTSADNICGYLSGKNILGRGNHFVDLCSGLRNTPGYKLMIIHTDGKSKNLTTPQTVEEALERQEAAHVLRRELGTDLAELIGSDVFELGNWTHNSVECQYDKVIYRKGVVKVAPKKLFMLPAHLGANILLYTVSPESMPPFDSLPHGTGRAGPRGELKVKSDKAQEIREMVYVPSVISNDSLRSEHPSCYNGHGKILELFGRGKYIVPVDEVRILSYVGKI